MRLNVFIIISVLALMGKGQNITPMKLKPIESKPSIPFTWGEYTPQESDPTILQNSSQKIQQREIEAKKNFNKLLDLYFEIREKMPPSEVEWYDLNYKKLCKNVETAIEHGNTGSASRLVDEYIKKLYFDVEIRYRLDSYKLYLEEINNQIYLYKMGKVSQATYDYWIYKNQFKFQPKYNEEEELIGFTPCFISTLYEDIDWNDAYIWITKNGTNSAQIENMWSYYFLGKLGSLQQEFEKNKFYLEHYLKILDSEELDPNNRRRIEEQIYHLKSILTNSSDIISYESYINNIKLRMIRY